MISLFFGLIVFWTISGLIGYRLSLRLCARHHTIGKSCREMALTCGLVGPIGCLCVSIGLLVGDGQ